MAAYQVVGPVVVLPEATTGLTKYYYEGAILPDGLDKDRVAACVADGLVAEVDDVAVPVDDGEPGGDDPDAVPSGTAAEILAWVGDDKAKAQRALDAERADKNRTTLTAELEKLAAPAPKA